MAVNVPVGLGKRKGGEAGVSVVAITLGLRRVRCQETQWLSRN